MEGNGGAYDPEARVARLAERVDNQGARITNLETAVNRGFADIQQTFGKQFNDLSNEMRQKDRTPWSVIWSAIGVSAVIIFGIGGALYYPVRETMAETKADVRALKESSMSVQAFLDFKSTYENNRVVTRAEYLDKFNQLGNSINSVREDQVPRKELERTWQLYDQQVINLQRQIDDLQRETSGIYTSRDKLLEQENEIKALQNSLREIQLRRMPATPTQ